MDVIPKPIDFDRMIAVIRRYESLGDARAERVTTASPKPSFRTDSSTLSESLDPVTSRA